MCSFHQILTGWCSDWFESSLQPNYFLSLLHFIMLKKPQNNKNMPVSNPPAAFFHRSPATNSEHKSIAVYSVTWYTLIILLLLLFISIVSSIMHKTHKQTFLQLFDGEYYCPSKALHIQQACWLSSSGLRTESSFSLAHKQINQQILCVWVPECFCRCLHNAKQ